MRRQRNRRRNRHGFTLMEVLLVLVILVIIGSLVGVGVRQARSRGFNDASRAQIKMFEKALKLYEMDLLSFPSANQGLEALIQPPSGLANESRWRGPYLDEPVLPLDPWDNQYQYALDQSTNMPKITSMGADGILGTDDDVTSD